MNIHLRQVVYVVNAWINKIDVDLMIYQVFVEIYSSKSPCGNLTHHSQISIRQFKA